MSSDEDEDEDELDGKKKGEKAADENKLEKDVTDCQSQATLQT